MFRERCSYTIDASFYRSFLLIVVVLCHQTGLKSSEAVIFSDVHWSSAIKLQEYEGYKSVALFSYKIPDQTAQTALNFEAKTIGDNCNFQEVYIFLQHGGYPLAFPYNESFPENFHTNKTDAHYLIIEKNKGMSQVIMKSPKAGQWYFAAFLPKQKHDKIEQKGFNQKCLFGMFIVVESRGFDDVEEIPIHKTNHLHLKQEQDKRTVLYRFVLPEDSVTMSVNIGNCSTTFAPNSSAGPSKQENPQTTNYTMPKIHNSSISSTLLPVFTTDLENSTVLESSSMTSSITPSSSIATESSNLSTVVSNMSTSMPESTTEMPTISPTTSSSCPVVMAVDFEKLPSFNSKYFTKCENQTECQIDVTSPKVGKWVYVQVALDPDYKVEDISMELKVKVERCESLKLVLPKSILEVFRSTRTSTNITSSLQQDSCVMLDSLGRYVWTEDTYNITFLRAEQRVIPLQAPLRDLHIPEHTVIVMNFRVEELTDIGGTLKFYSEFFNNTVESLTQYTVVHMCLMKNRIPGGQSVKSCSEGIHQRLNTSGSLSDVTYIPYPEYGTWYLGVTAQCVSKDTGEPVKCDRVPQINLDLSISGCVDSQCGKYGRCRNYISGVHVFSACDCIAGWRGYGCTDGRDAKSDQQELLAVLLLTLSNMFFIPAIVIAIYRRFFVEALVYTFTMFFSTFYHACDASNLIYYCMLEYDVLSFADFLGSISSFLVTMLAMADVGSGPRSFAHVMGVLGVAVGVEYDRHGLWVFAVPAGLAAIIMFSSWGFRCKKEKKLFPSKRYFLIHFLPGLVLAIVGLVLFAFLETKENYKITHSLWHVSMSSSIVFLLPNRKEKEGPKKDMDLVSVVEDLQPINQ